MMGWFDRVRELMPTDIHLERIGVVNWTGNTNSENTRKMQTGKLGQRWWVSSLLVIATLQVDAASCDAQLFWRSRGTSGGTRNETSHATNTTHDISLKGPITRSELNALLKTAVEHFATDWDTSDSRSPWGVMHNTLAWGASGEILINGKRQNSITSLCQNVTMKKVKLLEVKHGKLIPREGPGLQGHPGQLLAVLAQNHISDQQPIQFQGHEFTVADLIEYEKATCEAKVELTFKLLSLCHYLGTDAEWENQSGEKWSVERLLREELAQPINHVTCGGTHRLMAIGLAVGKRQQEALPIEGVWETAATYLTDYHEYALSLFNPDGSFSTEWFERRGAAYDLQKRLQTTGHVMEWLVVTLPESELESEQIQRSMVYLARLIQQDIGEDWSVGPRAHAIRAMRLYRKRLEALPDVVSQAIAVDEPASEPYLSSELKSVLEIDAERVGRAEVEAFLHPSVVEAR